MSQASIIRGANAMEGYIEEEIDRQRRQATGTRSVTRSEAALAWADQIAAETSKYGNVVGLIELLVKRGLSEHPTSQLDASIAEESKKVGEPLSSSIGNFVTTTIERRAGLERAESNGTPDDPPLGEGDIPIRGYAGIWRDTRTYSRGLMATHGGATWVATRATGTKPGTDDSGWRMIAKSKER